MTTDVPSISAEAMPDTHVALLLPATALPPEPARRINFLAALLLYWLMPRRIGPHLAAGTFKRALAAQIVAVALTAIIVAFWYMRAYPVPIESLHDLRLMLAEMVIVTAGSNVSVPWWVVVLIVIGPPLGLELILVMQAVLLMPWCAGGDAAWSVFKRSFKNVSWSTTLLPLITLAIGWLIEISNQKDTWFNLLDDMTMLGVILVTTAVPTVLYLRALLIGASRYVGSADGPAFRPREPLCDECGYRLTGLPTSAHCPECGLSVADSLPGGRRRPTVWQEHEFSPRGLAEAIRMQWRVLRYPIFFERLPVQGELTSARHFWWLTFMFILLVLLGASWLITNALRYGLSWGESDVLLPRILVAILGTLLPLGMQSLMAFAACLWAQFRIGIRDYRVSATVCYYASPLMWPFMAVVFAWCIALPTIEAWARRAEQFLFLGLWLDGPMLTLLGFAGLAIVALGFWWYRLMRALRSVRHANV